MRKLAPLALLLAVCLNSPLSAQWHSRYQSRQWKRQPAPTPIPTPIPAPTPTPAPSVSVADQIAADMAGQNEGYPHGVPLSWNFAVGPTMGAGNTPLPGWKAATAWGAIYVDSAGNPAINTRVNLRNVQFWLLRKSTGTWTLVQNTSIPDGAAYLEDFSGDSNKAADIRRESDGSISVTAGGGYNFHFYPRDRAAVSDIGGIVTLFQARLIVGDPTKPDDRASARYLASAGGDYWPDLTSGMPAGQTVEPAIASGKFKYLQSNWRSFAMATLSKTQLESNPPPVDLSGVLP